MMRQLVGILCPVLLACVPPATAASQAADAAAAIACTRAHWGEPFLSVVAACWKEDEAAAADAIADISLLIASAGGTAPAAYTSEPHVATAIRAKASRP